MLERAAAGAPARRPRGRRRARRRRARARRHGAPPVEARLAAADPPRSAPPWPRTRCASCSPPRRPYPLLGRPRARAVRQPGTSSSPAPRARRRRGRPGAGRPAPSAPRPSGSTRSRRWASTSSTCRRSTRSATRTARARTTRSTPSPDDPGSPWAIGSQDGGHDAIHPDLGTFDDFDAFVGRGPRRSAWRSRSTSRCRLAGPPLGHRAPGVVHHPRRRHDRVRREPAEEVPGHLPDQLRQRPRRHLRRGAAGRAGLDRRTACRLPGRQPAHQAGELLGVADRRGPQDRPRRDLPVRGVHPAAMMHDAGQGRVPPVLHLLHLAQREVGARGVPAASCPRRPAHFLRPELLRQHPGHPARLPAVRRPAGVQDPGRAGGDLSPSWGVYAGYELFEHVAVRPG